MLFTRFSFLSPTIPTTIRSTSIVAATTVKRTLVQSSQFSFWAIRSPQKQASRTAAVTTLNFFGINKNFTTSIHSNRPESCSFQDPPPPQHHHQQQQQQPRFDFSTHIPYTPMNILVYSGEGTSRTSLSHTVNSLRHLVGTHYDVMKIDAKGLITEPWQESTSLLVIPGGRDLPYCKDLSGLGNLKIKQYIENGGRYLGLCAGAYYGSFQVTFEPGTGLEVIGTRELGFFKGECRGTTFPGFVYDSEKGASAVNIQLNRNVFGDQVGFDQTQIYFNGGGYFVGVEQFPEVEVLAWYGDQEQQQSFSSYNDVVTGSTNRVAMIACPVGKGMALLSGVHPEYDASYLDAKNPEYGPLPNVVSKLLLKEVERRILFASILRKMGLKVSEENVPVLPQQQQQQQSEIPVGAIMGVPALKPLYLGSLHPSLATNLHAGLRSMADQDGLIRESNDDFQLVESLRAPVPFHAPSYDPITDEEKVVKTLIFCDQETPTKEVTPDFVMSDFFTHLQHARPTINGSRMKFGNHLLYGPVVSSTQTLLDKNFGFCQHLPDGLVCSATVQVAGRGRGRNSWISPPGCLKFSMVLRHSVAARHASAVFVQYLVALAVVESVCSLPGYEEIPLRLKWPNDIYAEAPIDHAVHLDQGGQGPKFVKIGGVLVNSNYSGNEFLLVIGCGINTTNPHPTTSINHLIKYHNQLYGKNLDLFTEESLLARIMVKLEQVYDTFIKGNGTGFSQFEDLYYKRWLHQDAHVTLTTMQPHQNVRIQGITMDYGLLRTVAVDDQGRDIVGQEYRLQPDGNSFDMMKGLISQKA